MRVSAPTPIQLIAQIEKVQEDQQLVFGWLYVSKKADGTNVVDHSLETVDPATLEKASYKFALEFRVAKEMHEGPQIGRLVEIMVFTPEKRAALGVPDGILPDGIWVGFKIDDEQVWKRVKSGELRMFSFGGRAIRRALGVSDA